MSKLKEEEVEANVVCLLLVGFKTNEKGHERSQYWTATQTHVEI